MFWWWLGVMEAAFAVKLGEASLWAFCSRRGRWTDAWRVRFQHRETLNGLVMVPVQCSSFPTGRLSHPIVRFSSAADSSGGCEGEQGKSSPSTQQLLREWGTSQAETGNLMIDAVSGSRERLLCCCCCYIPLCLPWCEDRKHPLQIM